MFCFNHFNFNVLDLQRSLEFYDKALGLKPVREKHGEDFTLVYLGDEKTGFQLELTYMHDRKEPYDLGEILLWLLMTWKHLESFTRSLDAFALLMRIWESILSKIQTDTGLR